MSDRIAIGVLTKAAPAELVDDALAATGRDEQRKRLLTEGLSWARRWRGEWQPVRGSAV